MHQNSSSAGGVGGGDDLIEDLKRVSPDRRQPDAQANAPPTALPPRLPCCPARRRNRAMGKKKWSGGENQALTGFAAKSAYAKLVGGGGAAQGTR